MPSPFSLTEALGVGFRTVIQKPWVFIGVVLITECIWFVARALGDAIFVYGGSGLVPTFVFLFIIFVLLTLVLTVLFHLSLRAHDAPETLRFKDAFVFKSFFPLSVVILVSTFALMFGLLLFIVPGILLGGLLLLTPYFIIQRGFSVKNAFSASIRLSYRNIIPLSFLGLFCSLGSVVFIILANVFVVGALVANIFSILISLIVIPVGFVATAHAYRTLAPV